MMDTEYCFEYDVALSFAGEDRLYVEQVADALRAQSYRVFYDKYEESDLWGKNLYDHLAEVYSKKARLCVMFISANYVRKLWTTHERKHAQARALKESEEYILPARFDDTEIPGLPDTVGYVSLVEKSPVDVARLVAMKLQKAASKANAVFPRLPNSDYTGTFNEWTITVDDDGRVQTSAEELAVTFGEMRMLDPRPASISLDLKKDLLINAVRLDDVLKEIDNFKVFYASFSSSLDLHKALASPTGASPSIAQRRSTLDLAKFARMTEPLERQLSDGLLLIRDLVGRVAWAKDAREAAESAIAFIERCLGQWLGELSTEGSGVDVWRESSEEAPALSLRLFLRREEQEDLYTSVGGHEFWSGAWWTADEFSNSILRRQFTPAVLCLAATKEISLNNRELMTKLLEPRTWSIGSA